jgi:hypothetical protein
MKFSSKLAVAGSSIALMVCALGSTAIARNAILADNATGALPGVMVEAPKYVAKHQKPRQHVVAPSTVSRRTLPGTETSSAAPMSVTEKLTKLASTTGSCVDGCVTSFKYGNAPWHGCSVSAGVLSPTCRNAGNFKTFNECVETGLMVGWRNNDMSWYCSSVALK